MGLREQILAEHSKAQTNRIIRWVGRSQARMDELVRLFLAGEYRVTQRAGWPLSYCAQKNPELIRKHIPKLIRNLKTPGLHDAVKRNTVRLLQDIPVPVRSQGELMNICFEYLASPDETVAVKVFAMTILEKLSRIYPDIRQELKWIIEERWDYETAAFHARGRKILKQLNQPFN